VAQFSAEFLSGMAGQSSRSRRLGDVGASAPANWGWGGPGKMPHLLLMVYARPGALAAWCGQIQGPLWQAAFEVMECLPTSDLTGVEPFGFQDGVSQPALDWECVREPEGQQQAYSNLVALGEFLLGYPNEYGQYTDRPLLAPAPANAGLPWSAEVPGQRDLGKNGTYVIFRQLQQDVRGFWRYLDGQANGDPALRQQLAEATVGRRMNGDPMLPLRAQPIAGLDARQVARNQFTYDADPDGARCPFGAHVRRANPRNADLPAGTSGWLDRLWRTLGFGTRGYRDDLLASARFHRLLRRGREYGPGLSAAQAVDELPDTGEHGVQFLCIGASILRQFEFIQNAWMTNTKFNGLSGESDPVLGNRAPVAGCPASGNFSIPRAQQAPARLAEVPQFITVRGGAYFFLPGLGALRYLIRSE
ncbi:MAG: Dyp-type peroxidase, partial [Terriglobales bacterium]